MAISSKRARAASLLDDEDSKMDMSSMIDMVFLLLIFFMVNSQIILIKQDTKVKMPVASKAKIPEDIRGRFVVNLWADGTMHDNFTFKTLTEEEITEIATRVKQQNDARGVTTYLHLRADKRVDVKYMKKIVAAAAKGNVSNIIYGTYTQQ